MRIKNKTSMFRMPEAYKLVHLDDICTFNVDQSKQGGKKDERSDAGTAICFEKLASGTGMLYNFPCPA